MFEDIIGLPLLTDAHKSVLRCYLAVSDVAALSLQGDWLNDDHLVESARIWLQRNALTASWLERIEVVAEAREIARALVEHELGDGDDARPEHLFTPAMTVQYSSPVVAKIWRRCNSAVSNSRAGSFGAQTEDVTGRPTSQCRNLPARSLLIDPVAQPRQRTLGSKQ
jgi:hypothetical protein